MQKGSILEVPLYVSLRSDLPPANSPGHCLSPHQERKFHTSRDVHVLSLFNSWYLQWRWEDSRRDPLLTEQVESGEHLYPRDSVA